MVVLSIKWAKDRGEPSTPARAVTEVKVGLSEGGVGSRWVEFGSFEVFGVPRHDRPSQHRRTRRTRGNINDGGVVAGDVSVAR